MIRTVPLVRHQEFFTVHTAIVYVIQVFLQLASGIRILILLASYQKLVHLFGFIIRIEYNDIKMFSCIEDGGTSSP